MIADVARSEWNRLGDVGEHYPGCIPDSDGNNVFDLLQWLVSGSSLRHPTTSSDVYCLAKVLRTLGVTSLVTVSKDNLHLHEFDENQLVVILDQNALPTNVVAK